MDIHLKIQDMINSVACIQRTSTFPTELVAKRMANIRNSGIANGATFNFHVV